MIKNLKIALKKQKRLIILFILTILVPSLFLSSAGIRAIKNERFRIAKQVENEHRRAADFIKAVIQSRLNKLDFLLQEWIQSPSLAKKDYTTLQNLIPSQEESNGLMEHIFIIYGDDEYFFPHYPGANKKTPLFTFPPLSPSQMDRLNMAVEHEFRLGEIKKAISLYQDLWICLG